MRKELYDICYEVLSHYLSFPDVADTLKSINDGTMYLSNYPTDNFSFQFKKGDIITFIQKARIDNIIYQYHENHNVFVPLPQRKRLDHDTRDELHFQLEIAVSLLKLKGIYQVVKHLYPEVDDNALSGELLESDRKVFDRYGLR